VPLRTFLRLASILYLWGLASRISHNKLRTRFVVKVSVYDFSETSEFRPRMMLEEQEIVPPGGLGDRTSECFYPSSAVEQPRDLAQ
jgi:hypothetical protein